MTVLSEEERNAARNWLNVARVQQGWVYNPVPAENIALIPLIERLLADSLGSEPDPYANKRTLVSQADVIGGKVDRGISRESKR